MLKIFRNPSPLSIIFLFIVTFGLKLGVLLHPVLPELGGSMVLYRWVIGILGSLLGRSAFAFTLFAILNLLLQAIILNQMSDRHRLFHHSSFLVAASFIIATSLIPMLNYTSAPLLANWLLLITFNTLLNITGREDIRKQLFNIGFCIAIAGLLYLPYLLLFIAVIAGVAILRPFKLIDGVLLMLGLLTPFYFLAAIMFLTDDLDLFLQQFRVTPVFFSGIKNIPSLIAAVVSLVIWGIIAAFYLNHFMQKMLLNIKKLWGVILMLVIAGILSTLVFQTDNSIGWSAFVLFASVALANPFFAQRRKWIVNVLFFSIIALAIWMQWFPQKLLLQDPKNRTLYQPVKRGNSTFTFFSSTAPRAARY